MFLIHPVPAFKDNYLWVIHNDVDAIAVDPGDAAVVSAYLAQKKLTLRAILITHHHNDHIGGVAALLEQCGALPVYGPVNEAVAASNKKVCGGDGIEALGLTFNVLEIPGHTAGHLAYYCESLAAVFCGDTLFACGCGRLFEGTALQMHTSLQSLAALPAHTRVYCAHEYTMANIAFALAVEPDNDALKLRAAFSRARRQKNIPTVPSTIKLELETNPFLRTHIDAVKQAAAARIMAETPLNLGVSSLYSTPLPHEIFASLRTWKDTF